MSEIFSTPLLMQQEGIGLHRGCLRRGCEELPKATQLESRDTRYPVPSPSLQKPQDAIDIDGFHRPMKAVGIGSSTSNGGSHDFDELERRNRLDQACEELLAVLSLHLRQSMTTYP